MNEMLVLRTLHPRHRVDYLAVQDGLPIAFLLGSVRLRNNGGLEVVSVNDKAG